MFKLFVREQKQKTKMGLLHYVGFSVRRKVNSGELRKCVRYEEVLKRVKNKQMNGAKELQEFINYLKSVYHITSLKNETDYPLTIQ